MGYIPNEWTTKQLRSGKFAIVENGKNILITNKYGSKEDEQRAILAAAAPDLLESCDPDLLKLAIEILSKQGLQNNGVTLALKGMAIRQLSAISKAIGK